MIKILENGEGQYSENVLKEIYDILSDCMMIDATEYYDMLEEVTDQDTLGKIKSLLGEDDDICAISEDDVDPEPFDILQSSEFYKGSETTIFEEAYGDNFYLIKSKFGNIVRHYCQGYGDISLSSSTRDNILDYLSNNK